MRFSHVLVREALYEDLPPSQRTELHLAVAGAIETVAGDDAGEHLAEVAHHYLTAGRADAIDRGIDYAARSGDRAMRLLAFEQAAAGFELAVAAAESHALPAPSICELRLKLGDAYWRAGDASRARAAFAAAAEVASGGEDVARAAVGFGAIVVEAGGVDRELVALLERALATMPADDHPLRAAVLGRFARELHFADQPDRRRDMAEEAVAMARRLGDDAALARALGDWHRAEWRPDNLDQRLAATEEIASLANAQNDRETLFHALAWRFADFVERGDLFAADRELAACEGVAAGLRQPAWSWQTLVFRAGRALADGRYDAGERLAREALDRGRSARGATASIYFTIADLIRRRETGGLEEIEPVVRRLGEEQPSRWLAGHVWILAESGRLDEARERLEAAAASGYPSPTPDVTMLIRHVQVAQVVFVLDDSERAEVLYDRLLPYADQWATHGVGGGTQGSVHRHLGLLATTLHRYDDAERHFTAALELHERNGARTWVAHTLHGHALMLKRRDAPGDATRASAMIERAAEIARTLGMTVLIDSLEARATAPSAQPTLEREGEYWAIGWDGRTVRVRDSKGVRYLAALLAEPHSDVPARALVAGESDVSLPTVASVDDGLTVRDAGDDHAGDQLDPQARQEYRARARELEGELEEARALNDPERVEQVREELDFLAGELSRAVGLGGRPRQAGSTAERARLNATRAIRTAIRRIADQDAALGDHLEAAVRTGNVCRYEPR
jgi:tetratricopeptide (TPR) repeat protein